MNIIVGTGLSILLSIAVTNILGPSEYGLFILASGLGTILFSFFRLDMSEAGTRFFAKYKAKDDRNGTKTTFVVTFFFNYVSSLVVGAILFFSGEYLASIYGNPELAALFRLMGLMGFVPPFGNATRSLLYGHRFIGRVVLMGISSSFFTFVITLWLISNGFGASGVVIGEILTSLLMLGISIILIKPFLGRLINAKTDFTPNMFMDIIKYGFYNHIYKLTMNISSRVNRLVLGFYAPIETVGYYGLATGMTTYIGYVSSPLGGAMFPAVSELTGRDDKETIDSWFYYSVKYMTVLALYILAVAIVGAPILFQPVFPSYIASTVLVSQLAIAVSEPEKERIISAVPKLKKKVRVIFPGIDLENVVDAQPILLRGNPSLLYVGRLEWLAS